MDMRETPTDSRIVATDISPDRREEPALTPTLVIGLGGTGTEAVRYLKRRLVWLWHRPEIEAEFDRIPPGVDPSIWHKEVWRRFEMEDGPPIVQLLAVDTWPWSNRTGQVYLNNHEYAYIGGYNATRVLEHLPNHPEIADWWRWPEGEMRPGQIHSGARQMRAIGRLSFYRRYREFWRKLKFQIDRMTSLQARQDTEDRGYQVASSKATRRIYIVCSLCGGTGAGAMLDVAARLRATFAEQAIISGIFALPSVFLPDLNSDLQKERVRANAYAALKELTYFQSHPFHLWLPGEEPVEVAPLFNRLFLVERTNLAGESLNSIEDVQQLIANQVFLEGMTDVGSRIWEYDVNVTMERRQREGKLVAYIYSSFANSSLVVPRDDMLEYCELKYADSLIRRGLLRKLTPDERNQLNADATQSFGRLQDIITGETEGVAEEAWEEEAWGEEEEDLTTSSMPGSRRSGAPLEQFQQEFNQIIQRYGLRGALHFAERLAAALDTRVEQTRQLAATRAEEFQQATERLNARRVRAPGLLRRVVGWLVSPIAGPPMRAHQRELAALQRLEADARRRMDDAIQQRNGWVRLQTALDPLADQLRGRVKLAENVRYQQVAMDMRRLFDTARPTDQRPYEMFTLVLGREYIEEELYPAVLQSGLDRRIRSDAAELLTHPEVCAVHAVTSEQPAPGTAEYETILEVAPTDQARLAAAVEDVARQSARAYIHPEQFHIRSILQTHNTDIQTRLRDLFTRCQPFWRYDLDIGGYSESDLEEIVFAGVYQKDHRNWKYLLRDFPEFKPVETDDPTRIDACRVVHGLPIEYLESLPDMKAKYDRFFQEHTGPLQLDQRWEPGGSAALPELTGEPPQREETTAAVSPPASSPPTRPARGEPPPSASSPSEPESTTTPTSSEHERMW